LGKRRFTLIELFVCIGILTSLGTLFILKAKPMIARYQLDNRLERLAKEFEWTHKIAKTTEAHFKVTLKFDKGKVVFKRVTDEPLSFACKNASFAIENIEVLLFEGKPVSDIEWTFTQRGNILPNGILELKCDRLKRAYTITLLPEEQPSILDKRT